jgi:hypothetical protein
MPVMTKDEVLDQLEALSHVERVRAMIALGRRGDAEARELIAALERGDFYERFLALYSCFGSSDQPHVLRALADPSRLLRGLAARLAVLVLDDQQAIQAFAHLSPSMRKPLLSNLRGARRQAVVDACLEKLATASDAQLLPLLDLGSPAVVERHASPLVTAAQPREWLRLAAHHPAVVLAILQARAEAATTRDPRLVELVNTLLPILGSTSPDGTMKLVRALLRTTPYDQLSIYEVDSNRPNEGADLILTQDAPVSRRMDDFAARITVERLIALLEYHHEVLANIDTWFPHLDPAARATLYASPSGRRYITQALLPGYSANLLRALPGDARQSEARRLVKRWRNQPERQMQFASCLPWGEALAILDSGLHATDASLRAQSVGHLIDACAYSRDRLSELLTLLQERRSEQDGVRQEIFTHLAALPPSIWRAEHLPAVEELIRHGLNDVGLSAGTQQQMVALLARLLPRHTTWAAGQVATIVRERGWSGQPNRRSRARYRRGGAYNVRTQGDLRDLPPTAARELTAALLPVLAAWVARDDTDAALTVAKALPLRRRDAALLQPLLEDILRRTHTRSDAEQALDLLTTRIATRLATLIPELLAEDASWVTLSLLARWLQRHRSDLLAPYLSRQSYAGRWGTGARPYLVALDVSFTGGTTRQQERYAAALGEIIADESLPSREWTQAVQRLALLPVVGVERLAAVAGDARSVVRTTALFALARLDTSAGVPTLVEALGDARARIAISALRPLVLRMPPDEALAILRAAPMERVTVAKEIVRLIADLKSDAAYAELLALAPGDLHRDVRIALLRSLDLYLDREPTWALLEAAVHVPDPELATAPLSLSSLAASTLDQRQPASIQRRAVTLAGALLQHADDAARRAALDYCAQLMLSDDTHVAVPRLLDLARTAPRDEASRAFRALCGVCPAEDATLLSQALRDVLPDRLRLSEAVKALQFSWQTNDDLRMHALAGAAITGLAADPVTAEMRAAIAIIMLPAQDLEAFFLELATRGEFHAGVLVRSLGEVRRQTGRFSPAQLSAIEQALATSGDAHVRRLAFAFLLRSQTAQGLWTDDLVERLHRYRADPTPVVATPAQLTFTSAEEGEDAATDVDADFDFDPDL